MHAKPSAGCEVIVSVHCDDLEEIDWSECELEPTRKVEVLAEGILEKRGFWNPSWKARYFVLDSRGRLFYYKSFWHRMANMPAGKIALTRDCSVSNVQQGDKFFIDLHVPANGRLVDRTFHFLASSQKIGQKW
eukprot:CAMPEP_0113661844 /NCGR_PEP_ID=MMETSP0038_2-20120614/217_1 /TAXON_ID=2898 /ORGANISM="Cryptomonas paramecium" /LENGTH=132 /DNA_ID=CAMNT_0000576615 /DNA_START=1 /DNA_END=396 /DNA_ORIENTATION=+ /assembly_acc=CAM_ASM_000170